MSNSAPIHLAIFASGGGSNARALLQYFARHARIQVALLVTNNPRSGIWQLAETYGLPAHLLTPAQCRDGAFLLRLMQQHHIELIALAGYLKMIPPALIQAFPKRILNIHPALLPRYGGKGMYGIHIHRAVIEAGESHSGLTIHYVNEAYDEGEIIFQLRLPIPPGCTPEQLQQLILEQEHRHYPQIVEKVGMAIPS